MSFISKDIDLQRSKEQSPSNYSDGVILKKRIRTLRSNCTWSATQEFRVDVNNIQNIRDLTDSYKVYGMLYDEPVQVVEVDPNNKDRFLGVAGHHRDKAQEELGWDYAIYDVVEFETPQDRIAFGATSNHHTPKACLTKEDLVKVITMAVKDGSKGCLTNDDASVKGFISRIAKNKTSSQQDGIFKKYRSTKSKYESMKPLDGKAANELAAELNVPYEGDENIADSGECGYVKEPGGYKTLLFDGLRLWHNEGCSDDINVTGYVKDPTPTNLFEKRSLWMKEFKKMEDFTYDMCSNMTGMSVADIKSKGKFPFKFNGFLPQNLSPDITNGGNPVETDIVDIKGKSIK